MTFGNKRPFEIVERHREGGKVVAVTYKADFWEGPVDAGDAGFYVRKKFTADLKEASRTTCSFRDELLRAFK